jgi:hypothetical protein
VYAQFDIWKENAIWGEQQSSADPPPYPAYGRYAPPTAGSQQQASSSSYCDMAYVLQVNNNGETTIIFADLLTVTIRRFYHRLSLFHSCWKISRDPPTPLS